MILEVADIRVKEGSNHAFESAVKKALVTVFPKAQGFLSGQFHRCIETPQRYVLQLQWKTLEDHTVNFRGSALFTEWRTMVGDHFSQPPMVEHFTSVNE